jgi:hypothetical protein
VNAFASREGCLPFNLRRKGISFWQEWPIRSSERAKASNWEVVVMSTSLNVDNIRPVVAGRIAWAT